MPEIGASGSTSVAEQLGRVLASVRRLDVETVGLSDALGRALAVEVLSRWAIPPFDNAAMDGYAVRRADVEGATPEHPVGLPVVDEVAAGRSGAVVLGAGTAVRIMTGAPVPEGADAIVPIEQAAERDGSVSVLVEPVLGAHIRRAAEDARPGSRVLAPGVLIAARHLAAAASAGHDRLVVARRPRVAVISTGDELVDAAAALEHGRIPDSNSHLLQAAVTSAGGIAVRHGAVPDDEGVVLRLIERAAAEVDVVVVSGGASVGAHDVVKAVLAPRGVEFRSVRMQPGKPQGFGLWHDGTPIFALPGNPVSAAVSFEVFVRPALQVMTGLPAAHPLVVRAVAAETWPSRAGRRQYVPVRLESAPTGGPPRASRPVGAGSHRVAGLALADGLAVVDEDRLEVLPGDEVEVMLFG